MKWFFHRMILPVYWVVLAALVLACDYATGPYIHFPVLFIIPVRLAAWYSGLAWGLAMAIGMPLIAVVFPSFWPVPWTRFEDAVNALIQIIVLGLLAVRFHWTATRTRALQTEVKVLEGMLPICSFCKKIRTEGDAWEPVEQYVTEHSEAEFTHSICPECLEKHYGHLRGAKSAVVQ